MMTFDDGLKAGEYSRNSEISLVLVTILPPMSDRFILGIVSIERVL